MFKRKPQISDMDAWVEERLSEYLDGTLSPQERASVEAHLKQSARARASLESLRWTVNLVKQTPAPALPRQFTLPVTQRAPARGAPAWFVWSLRGVAVAATAAFVILLTATLLRQNVSNESALSQSAAPAATLALVALAPTQAPIAAAKAPTQGAAADVNAIPSPRMITVPPPPPTSEIMPVTVASPPTANATPLPAPTMGQTQDTVPAAAPQPQQPTTAAQKAQPSATTAASASGAAGAAPELSTTQPSPTSESMVQRTLELTAVDGLITTANLQVRQGPGVQYPVIGRLKRGERIQALARNQDGNWLMIRYDKNLPTGVGWVSALFVQLNSSSNALPILPTPEPTETIELVTPTATAATATATLPVETTTATPILPLPTEGTPTTEGETPASATPSN